MTNVFEYLDTLGIDYRVAEHAAVYTVDEAVKVRESLDLVGDGCKNLFLRDKKKNYYLLIMPHDKQADMKYVAQKFNLKRLSFGSEEELKAILGLTRGAVSPLGLVNDRENEVTVLLDRALVGQQLVFHPNTNTMSLSLKYMDFEKYLNAVGNKVLTFA